MELIDYLRSLMPARSRVKPIQLVSKIIPPTYTSAVDNVEVVTPIPLQINESSTSEEGLLKAFPKEMNWLNWDNKGFRDALLDSQIYTESRGNPNAVGPMTKYGTRAVGAAQIMPITWTEAKRQGWIKDTDKRTDLTASLKAQQGLMTSLYNKPEMKSSDELKERYAKTLAAYNAGYGSLRKAIRTAKSKGGYWLDYMGNETKKYIPQIMGNTEREYFKSKEDYVSKYKRDINVS